MKYRPKKKNILKLEQYLNIKINERTIKEHQKRVGN